MDSSPYDFLLVGILILGLILHTLGIYCCCCKRNRKLKNQKIILLNLSGVEIFTILFMMLHLLLDNITIPPHSKHATNLALCTVYHAITNLFYQTMILIPLDRLVCIVSPTFYYANIHVSTVKKSVTIIWVVSVLSSAPFAFLVDLTSHMKIVLYSSYFAQGVFFVVSTVAYVMVARYQMNRRRLFGGPTTTNRPGEWNRTFLMPFFINMSFAVFYVLPNYVALLVKDSEFLSGYLRGLSYVGLVVDPIVYILLHKDIRPIARRLFTSRFPCRMKEKKEGDLIGMKDIGILV